MDRELTYKVPFARLRKLGRNSGRKAYPYLWGIRWLVLGVFLFVLLMMGRYEDAIERWQESMGLPPLTALAVLLASAIAAIMLMRRYGIRQTKARANFDSDVRLRQDDGGIHIATDEIEYYLKWPGISQLIMEHDGVVLSHGSFFFLVPDAAFEDLKERDAFVRGVFARLGADAQKRSEKSMRPVLEGVASSAGP